MFGRRLWCRNSDRRTIKVPRGTRLLRAFLDPLRDSLAGLRHTPRQASLNAEMHVMLRSLPFPAKARANRFYATEIAKDFGAH